MVNDTFNRLYWRFNNSKMIINAQNLILGRLASFAAKKALLGEKIDIINCGNAVVIGSKKEVLDKYKRKSLKGTPKKGPFFQKNVERFVKRSIRGMLPYKKERGKTALKKIKCYVDIPQNLKDKEILHLEQFDVFKTHNLNFVRIDQICKFLGGR